jgi:hypothetical protein
MPEPEVALAKKWVPPWRGPNPVWRIALGVAIWVTGAAGAVVFVTGLRPGGDSLRSLGFAVLLVAASAGMLQGPRKKSRILLLVGSVVLLLVAGYRLATS